jgi:hypothetical protein
MGAVGTSADNAACEAFAMIAPALDLSTDPN